jgi:16S rRNA (cytosine1402-N4)-methyltransferase
MTMADGQQISFSHDPVMRDEIVGVFAEVPPGTILDATLGGGGHSEALLEARDDVDVIGLDRDPEALHAAIQRLEHFGSRFRTTMRRFDDIDEGLAEHGVEALSGAIFDLGVSSHQLDEGSRGFSYRNDGPLDMRMGPDANWTADDVVNGYDIRRLADIIRRYGEERFASRIANAIVAARPIETTNQLAEVVVAAIPAPARRTGGHPAKRTFQAIRIEVNGELDLLPTAIDKAIDRVVPGGRVAVLSYHSGEDRIVKQRMMSAANRCECPPELPCVCGAVQTVRIVRKVAKKPSAAEIKRNRRSTSARLRVAERIAEES